MHFFFLISSCYVPTSLFGFFQLHRILAKNLYDFRYGRANELPWFVRLAVTNLWISLGSEMAFQFLKMKMPGKTKKETNKFGRRTYSSTCWYINGIDWTTFSCYLSWETIPSNIYWCDFFFQLQASYFFPDSLWSNMSMVRNQFLDFWSPQFWTKMVEKLFVKWPTDLEEIPKSFYFPLKV